jgi:hypothetical protein
MGFIDMYDENKYFVHNGLLHETGHQWCCFIGDNFAKGKDNPNLEIIQGFIHFYRGLESPHDTGTPMKSDFWVDKGNGIYSRQNQQRVKKYHPFELYFMGLLTKDNFDFNKKFNLYDAGIVGKDFNDQTAVPYKKVSIQDIINVEGIRKCNTPATSSILALKKSTPLEPIK